MTRRATLRNVLIAFPIVLAAGSGRAQDQVPAVGASPTSTGCFTDTIGHPFETFICWMKDNNVSAGIGGGQYGPGQSVTRGEMAVFMQSSADVPPATGLITVHAGNGNWRPFSSTDDLKFSYFSNALQIAKPGVGSSFVAIHPDLPTTLYGRSLQLVGVELCYAASADAFVTYVELNVTTSSAGAGTRLLVLSDATDRTDSACRYYVPASPVGLSAEHGANFYLQGTWTVANSPLSLSRTTFVLQPTETVAVPPSRPGAEMEVLRPRDPGDPQTETASR